MKCSKEFVSWEAIVVTQFFASAIIGLVTIFIFKNPHKYRHSKKPPTKVDGLFNGRSAIKGSVKTQSYQWFASREQGLSYNDSKLCMEKEYLDV